MVVEVPEGGRLLGKEMEACENVGADGVMH
jgi:hypothetical protein